MKINVHLCLLILGILLKPSLVLAGTGYCTPTGGTESLQYDWGSYTFTDPSLNVPGTTAPEHTLTASGAPVTVNCACESGKSYDHAWLWGDTTLSGETTVGDYNYYDIPNNDYLQVGVKIYTAIDSLWHSIPFGPISDKTDGNPQSHPCNSDFSIATGGTHTGAQLKVSLRIKKSFVGTSIISPVIIASTYWTLGDGSETSHGPTPVTNIFISGTVSVPQSCSINDGGIVTVDFGQLYSGEFKTKGTGPQVDKTVTVPIKCNNIDAGANLTLRFQAEPSADYNDAIKTTNSDIGVVVKDDNGNVVTPNSGLIPFSIDDSLRADVTFHLEPVSTTGKAPAEGQFQAQAYIRVDFA